jgi:hypothetical protein
MMEPGIYVKVYERDGSYVTADAHCEPSVDAAVSRWIDSRETHDTLLSIDLMDGATYRCLASRIASWYVSTPETRRRAFEWEAAHKAEERLAKEELGIWDDAE